VKQRDAKTWTATMTEALKDLPVRGEAVDER
jgi:hypothetical protein